MIENAYITKLIIELIKIKIETPNSTKGKLPQTS